MARVEGTADSSLDESPFSGYTEYPKMSEDRPSRRTLTVSQRGQITLPAELRKRLGIREGGVVTVQERGGELILRPAAIVELETYSDEDIGRWEEEDRLSRSDKQRLKAKLLKNR